ncbi:hypothetical protein JTE90_006039 [Oedothorax gibbosus]|uniref:BESS domain-containing protein n=1 Tax=Oedothorax gibbosus TaxID=931172 RepID=A0AAV6V0F0_9ARAC|nr:hypothetical protein JTE90_006039 [Oedothorax gibbosus]
MPIGIKFESIETLSSPNASQIQPSGSNMMKSGSVKSPSFQASTSSASTDVIKIEDFQPSTEARQKLTDNKLETRGTPTDMYTENRAFVELLFLELNQMNTQQSVRAKRVIFDTISDIKLKDF